MARWPSRLSTLVALGLLLSGSMGCPGGDVGDGPVEPAGFDDHTIAQLPDVETFNALAVEGPQSNIGKFLITDFADVAGRRIRFYDNTFYELHDEWYWFRLLNGASVPASDRTPEQGHQFATVQEVTDWANTQSELPLGLRFAGTRLYSPEFYDKALSVEPRDYGLGTIVHYRARTQPPRNEIWAFELEYQDELTYADLAIFFEMLLANTPSEIGAQIQWLVRSPQQETLAQTMESESLRYADRILRYDDLVVDGEVEVYSEGLAAGRVNVIRSGQNGTQASLQNSRSTDVLILEDIPDFLPPASALITGLPQTPLAHINVLARNRGIPNAYLGGLLDDPNLDQLARVRAPVIVQAQAPNTLRFVPITEGQFASWRSLSAPPEVVVPSVDLSSAPYTMDLLTLDPADVDNLRPLIGGKAAGTLGLLAIPELSVVDQPLAVTARAYHEHVASLLPLIETMLSDDAFSRSARTRYLVLEGPVAFALRYPTPDDADFAALFLEEHSSDNDVLGQFVRGGGLKQTIIEKPMNASTLQTIRNILLERYQAYSHSQGLRFRSSSTIEDIEGFNGAGLYSSHTGYLYPDQQNSAKKRSRSVENALKTTWASYWGSEAFEERRLSRVNHLSGDMAALVHARFDDNHEINNGVFTFTVLPEEFEEQAVLWVNVQLGPLSVTNPPPGQGSLPEVDRLTLVQGQSVPVIERLATSSELNEGDQVLSDARLLQLFSDAQAVTEAWLARENVGFFGAQQRRTLTLDFEHREMAAGWPALANGSSFARRLVIKQARSLEPSLARVPQSIRSLPIPRDVLSRARRIERRTCESDRFHFVTVEVYTDPLAQPDLGHTRDPFTGFFTLEVKEDVPELGLPAGQRTTFVHTTLDVSAHPGMDAGGPWALDVQVASSTAENAGIDQLRLVDGSYTLGFASAAVTGAYTCTTELQFSTPDEFLLGLLEEAGRPE